MILSVSRRSDIPNYYSDWFLNRIKEGFLYVRNPMSIHQVSKINLSPDVVDCIVFWTKNPKPMLDRIDELSAYKYYFQFTLTGYGKDVEENLPDKKKVLVPTFKELSSKIGCDKVIWRYDPILFNNKYTEEYHIKAFTQIAESLKGYTRRCVISFIDLYVKNKKNMESLGLEDPTIKKLKNFTKKLYEIARKNEMEIFSCAESVDLSDCGVNHGSCIDKTVIEKVIGCKINVSKDKNQRKECGCVESVEVGCYNTCLNGCKYCYANYNRNSVKSNFHKYDADSPILCSSISEEDKISERKLKSLKEEQMSLFDI